MSFRAAGIFALTVGLAAASWGQEPPRFAGVKLANPPKLDGLISQGEWPDSAKIESQFRDDSNGAVWAEPVQFWVGYDRNAVYFAAILRDNPKTLKADEFRRNVRLNGNDQFSIGIDAFGKGTNLSFFAANPNGATEMVISGGRAGKVEWLGAMEASAKITETGWQVEARIPWSVMDLPTAGLNTLRFNAFWYRTQAQRWGAWTYTKEEAARMPFWTDVETPRSAQRRNVQLLPFAYGGYDAEKKESLFNSGLDFKTSLTDQLQAVGTINPDFRNIENQLLSLDFSYFERLAGETRPFFLEGRGYRDFGFGNRLFASQRIQRFDAGINTFGSIDDATRVSFLSALDFGNSASTVATFERRLDSKSEASLAYVGLQQPDLANHGLRGTYSRQFGDWNAFAATQFTDDQVQGSGFQNSASLSHQAAGANFFLSLNEVTPKYTARLGFVPERNYRGASMGMSWEKLHPRGPVMETEQGFNFTDWRRFDGTPYRRSMSLQNSITTRDGADFDVSWSQTDFNGFLDHQFYISLENPRGDGYRSWSVGYSGGRIRDQRYESYEVDVRYRPIKRIQASLSAEWLNFGGWDRQIVLGLNWEKGFYESLSARLVERGGQFNWYMSFRRSGNTGAEFFLILGDPNADTFQRQVILKAIVPLELRF